MMINRFTLSLFAAIILFGSTQLSAEVLTRTFAFSASDFTILGGGIPYPGEVAGNVTVTFDEDVNKSTSLVDAINLNISGYDYSSNNDVYFEYYAGAGVLAIGRIIDSGGDTFSSSTYGTDDIYISLDNVESDSVDPLAFQFMTFTSSAYAESGWTFPAGNTSANEIPEPASIMLLGFATLTCLGRGRKSRIRS